MDTTWNHSLLGSRVVQSRLTKQPAFSEKILERAARDCMGGCWQVDAANHARSADVLTRLKQAVAAKLAPMNQAQLGSLVIAANDSQQSRPTRRWLAQVVEQLTIPALEALTSSYEAGQNRPVARQQQ